MHKKVNAEVHMNISLHYILGEKSIKNRESKNWKKFRRMT